MPTQPPGSGGRPSPARGPTGPCSTAATTRRPARPAAGRRATGSRSSSPPSRRPGPPAVAGRLPTEPPALRLVEPQLGDRRAPTCPTSPRSATRRRCAWSTASLAGSARPARRPVTPRRTTLTALDRSTTPPVPAEGRRRPADLRRRPVGLVHRSRRGHGRPRLGQPERHRLARRREGRHPGGGRRDRRPACPSGCPRPTWCPGSPLREERPLRIVRDAASIAAHTTGYFRGWRRGQEIGGYAIGGRPGRESAGGWDFTRDGAGRGRLPQQRRLPQQLTRRDLTDGRAPPGVVAVCRSGRQGPAHPEGDSSGCSEQDRAPSRQRR